MAFLALALFAIVLVLAYLISKKDLLSPWFLLCLAITVSFFIVTLNYSKWEVKINGTFIVFVLCALMSWGVGAALVRRLSPRAESCGMLKTQLPVKSSGVKRRYPAELFIIVSLAFMLGYVTKLFLSVSDVPSITAKLRQIYDNTVNGYSPGTIFIQMREVVVAIAYINTFRLFQRLFSGKDGVSVIKLIVPIVAFGVVVLVSTDRNIFLRYAIYFICLFVLFLRENIKSDKVNVRIVQCVLVLLLLMVIIFFIMGKMKQYKSDIFHSLSIYGGSGLYDFNLWLETFDGKLQYGVSTFQTFLGSLESILKPLGISFGDIVQNNRFDPFIEYTTSGGFVYTSNIYSAFKPYVEDFGCLGMVIFPFVTGMFYEWLYLKVKRSKYSYSWLIYCALIYPVIFYPIAEQLFRRFHLGIVYEIFWLTAIYLAVYGNNGAGIRRKRIRRGQKR